MEKKNYSTTGMPLLTFFFSLLNIKFGGGANLYSFTVFHMHTPDNSTFGTGELCEILKLRICKSLDIFFFFLNMDGLNSFILSSSSYLV